MSAAARRGSRPAKTRSVPIFDRSVVIAIPGVEVRREVVLEVHVDDDAEDGANRCPPEDIGGPPGYQEFLDALRDVTHPEHESTLDWWLSVATPDDPVFLADEFDVAGKDREIGAAFRGEPIPT